MKYLVNYVKIWTDSILFISKINLTHMFGSDKIFCFHLLTIYVIWVGSDLNIYWVAELI